jgi:hypothetical protein
MMGYLTTLQQLQRLLSSGLERIGEEAVVAYFKVYYPGTGL